LLAILELTSLAPTTGIQAEETEMVEEVHYRKPGMFTRRVLNPFIVLALRAGISIWGSRILEVRGRKSGAPRRTPVNLLEVDDRQYLVAPRGEAQWVRNVRADHGRLALLLGRHRDERVAQELPDSEKPPVLRAYLRRWKMEVGVFFDGVGAGSDEEDLQRIAADHPVFLLSPANS
jgi:deazaflavin-dependent oxidoreductase (nitroreductase family)